MMLQLIDNQLNKITMYRLVLYSLLVMVGSSILFGLFGLLSFTATQLILSAVILFIVCYGSNYLLAKIFNAPTNIESSTITSLILFFILTPAISTNDIFTLILAGILAMASKYLLAIHKQHIFNPAAIAAVILVLFGNPQVSWWIATFALFPITLIAGLLIVRKIRRFQLFFSFLLTSFIVITFFGVLDKRILTALWIETLISWPLIFFGTIMLTEPFTTPPTKKLQMFYGILVGVLCNIQFHFGPIFSSPEFALVIGNIFSYFVSPKQKLFLTFKKKNQIAQDTYEFIFQTDRVPSYKAGQYLEWTLPHKKSDSRGNRRYFTVASSPTENEITLGVRFNTPPSSYKNALLSLQDGSTLVAAQLAGDFTLPKDSSEKLVLIAGGIGITPFRSMIKYLIDKNEKRDIVLLYANKHANEIAYQDLFAEGEKAFALKTISILSNLEHIPKDWKGRSGHIDEKLLQEEIPDFKERTFYLSGPIGMVNAYKALLRNVGITPKKIVTDYFPGF